MKKIVFTSLILSYIASNVLAQDISLRGGFNLSNMLIKSDFGSQSDDYKARPGFHFGGIVNFPLSNNFSIETGILFTTKGYRQNLEFPTPSDSDQLIIDDEFQESTITTEFKIRMNLSYIDLPLAGKMVYDLKDVKIYGLVGPYLGYGVSGQLSGEEIENGEIVNEETQDIEWGTSNGFKRFDYGLYMGAGIEINNFQIGINYSWGLANINNGPDNSSNQVHRNRALGLVSIGYRIGEL